MNNGLTSQYFGIGTFFGDPSELWGQLWSSCNPYRLLKIGGSSPRSGNLVLKLYSPMKQRSFTKIQGWHYAGHTIHGDSSAKKPSKIDRPFRFAEKLIWIKIVSSNLFASDTHTRAWPTIDSSPTLQDAQFQTYRFHEQNIYRNHGSLPCNSRLFPWCFFGARLKRSGDPLQDLSSRRRSEPSALQASSRAMESEGKWWPPKKIDGYPKSSI